MDFGSARPAVVEIGNRMDAMALQEEAEVGLHDRMGVCVRGSGGQELRMEHRGQVHRVGEVSLVAARRGGAHV